MSLKIKWPLKIAFLVKYHKQISMYLKIAFLKKYHQYVHVTKNRMASKNSIFSKIHKQACLLNIAFLVKYHEHHVTINKTASK